MMELVKVDECLWVNPSVVNAVTSGSGSKSYIWVSGEDIPFSVSLTAAQVAEILRTGVDFNPDEVE